MNIARYLARLCLALILGAAEANAADVDSVVPMTLTRGQYGGGRIYLPVRIANMLGAMRLDTGASTTRIRLAPWNKDLPVLGQSDSTGASGRTTRCETVSARNIELKASTGAGVARSAYELSRCLTGDGEDLLGLDFFKGAHFTLDFGRSDMVFSPPAPDARAKAFIPLGPEQRLVGVDLRLGDTSVVGLFDTGAEVCAVDRQFVDKHKKLFTPVKGKLKASEASGRSFSPKLYRIKEVDLGEGRILRGVYALVYDFGVLREALGSRAPLILGVNLLSAFNWELNFTSPAAAQWDARAR